MIELLVVVAIIALLLSILMPALAGAREAGRAAVCLSNVRSISLGFFTYANDYRVIPGTHHQGLINLDWCGRNNVEWIDNMDQYDHPMQTSVLYDYIDNADAILACPTVKREANNYFDYVAVIRMAGARTDLPWLAGYKTQPRLRNASPIEYLPSLPLLVEEDYTFFNSHPVYAGGSWAWFDQFTDRHDRKGTLGFLDGSVQRFKTPKGPNPAMEEAEDLTAEDFHIFARKRRFDVYQSTPEEFGWVNGPR